MSNQLIKNFLKVFLTIAIFGLLLWIIGWREIAETIAGVNLRWLLIMYFFNICARIIEAYQMKILLLKSDAIVSFARIFLANSLAALYALLLPGDLISAGAKWANLSAATGKKALILNAIIYNRFAILLIPLLFGVLTLILQNPFPETIIAESASVVGILVVSFALVFYHPLPGNYFDRFIGSFFSRFPLLIREKANNMITALQKIRSFKLRDHLTIIMISSAIFGLNFAAFFCGAKTLGLTAPISTLVWIYAVLIMLRQLPITIGNLGVREGLLIVILNLYNITSETAFSLGLILFTNHLLFGLVGAGYQLSLNFGWTRWKPGKKLGANDLR
jgi:uncharacterized membrane protein YbhN (UPF0104 family)